MPPIQRATLSRDGSSFTATTSQNALYGSIAPPPPSNPVLPTGLLTPTQSGMLTGALAGTSPSVSLQMDNGVLQRRESSITRADSTGDLPSLDLTGAISRTLTEQMIGSGRTNSVSESSTSFSPQNFQILTGANKAALFK